MENQSRRGGFIDRLKLGLLSRANSFAEGQKRRIELKVSQSATLLYGTYLSAMDMTLAGEIDRTGLDTSSFLSGIDDRSKLSRRVLLARALRNIKDPEGNLNIEIAVSYERATTPSVILMFTQNSHEPDAPITGATIALGLPIRAVGKPIILDQQTYINMLGATIEAQSVMEGLETGVTVLEKSFSLGYIGYMRLVLLILIGLLLVTGNINLPGVKLANPTLFYALGHSFTLFNLLLFILILWCLSYLGGVVRSVVIVLLLLWVLSIFGLVVTSGFSSLIVSAIIVGILLHFLGIM